MRRCSGYFIYIKSFKSCLHYLSCYLIKSLKCDLRGKGFVLARQSSLLSVLAGKPRGRSLRRSLTLHKQSGNKAMLCSLSPGLQSRKRCHPQWAGLPSSVKIRPSRHVQRWIPQVILELIQLTMGTNHHKSRQSECHQLTQRHWWKRHVLSQVTEPARPSTAVPHSGPTVF